MQTVSSRQLGKDYSRRPLSGTRESFADVLVRSMPKTKREQLGYKLALYVMRNNFLPHAYCRSDDMWTMEDNINLAITRMVLS